MNVNIHNEDTTTVNTDTTVSVEDDDGTEYVRMTCDDFVAQPGAQAYYERFPEQGAHLDSNGNGLACEMLPEEPDREYEYELTVQVVTEDGYPIENELVEFDRPHYNDDPQRHITDEDGLVTFWYTAASPNEYRDYTYTIRDEARGTERVEVGDQFERVVVNDDAERETYELEVYVDETRPIEDVDVTIHRTIDGATTTKTTDEEGRVTFDVYPGEYQLTASYAGDEHHGTVTVEEDRMVYLPSHGPPRS